MTFWRRSEAHRRLLILAGTIIVLTPPAALLRHLLKPEPWDAAHLLVHFESVRYERAGLVFAYRVENRTRRAGQFPPQTTVVRVMQPSDRPSAGFPVVRLPLEIAPRATQRVELRLELPLPRSEEENRERSDEQTERVLQHKLPGPRDLESPLSPLPMIRSLKPPPSPPERMDIDALCRESLNTLQGFELIEREKGIRMIFPRGW